MDLHRLDSVQVDGLREVANIGAGHAATALSRLTQRQVSFSVPDVRVVRLEEIDRALGAPDAVVAAVVMRILGDLTGRTVQLFDSTTAAALTSIMLDRQIASFPDDIGAAERSMLTEASNVITGAFLNAMSDLMGIVAIMSVPEFAIDMTAAVLLTSYVNFGDVNDYVFYMSTRLEIEGSEQELRTQFLLLPDAASLAVILRSLRLA
jgi:chemotaxis protein CheC